MCRSARQCCEGRYKIRRNLWITFSDLPVLQAQHGGGEGAGAAGEPVVQLGAQGDAALGFGAGDADAVQGAEAAQRPGGGAERAKQIGA